MINTFKRITLRNWQQDAFEIFQIENKENFLAVANPGAGKTGFALYTARNLFLSGKIERIVIVCPTLQLKEQWSLVAEKSFGLDIAPDSSNYNCVENDNYHGVALTYHQVCSFPDIHRLNCYKKSTMVIFDEIHHVGDNLKWGDAVRRAFEYAKVRLSLSGTPFRNDNNPIPYINYIDNKSQADYIYNYADSLRDGVCRYIFFPSFEGEMRWESFGNVINAKFDTKLNILESARRLRTALSPNGEWLKTVIRQADEKLNDIRNNGHTDAGGLIVAIDQFHAKQIVQLIFNITGEQSVLAISEDSEALKLIKDFSNSSGKWIVAVKMISEGVDIPRLRVGIYATNCTSELFFRQVVGRFIRVIPGLKEQNAYLFIPKDDTLKSFARAIMKERDHQLEEELNPYVKRTVMSNISTNNNFTILSSLALQDEVISADGELIPVHLINFATQIKSKANISTPVEEIAKILQIAEHKVEKGIEAISNIKDLPKIEKISLLRNRINTLVSWLGDKTSVGFNQMNFKLNQIVGISNNQTNPSEELLDKKFNVLSQLKKLLKENNNEHK